MYLTLKYYGYVNLINTRQSDKTLPLNDVIKKLILFKIH